MTFGKCIHAVEVHVHFNMTDKPSPGCAESGARLERAVESQLGVYFLLGGGWWLVGFFGVSIVFSSSAHTDGRVGGCYCLLVAREWPFAEDYHTLTVRLCTEVTQVSILGLPPHAGLDMEGVCCVASCMRRCCRSRLQRWGGS